MLVPDAAKRMIAVVITAWRILGIGLAFAKGQSGDVVSWIGATLSIESSRTLAITIVKSRLNERRTIRNSRQQGTSSAETRHASRPVRPWHALLH